MNKATFENWLNNEIFEDVVYFFAKDAPSQTLKNTLIKEHGQEYFDTILSDYINKNLEEITNINNLLTEVRFWGLDNCLHINENIAKNVSNNLYKLLKKHLAKEFEIKSGIYSRYEVDLPEPTVGRSFTNGFHIASNNKRFFSEEQIQSLFDDIVNVLKRRENKAETDLHMYELERTGDGKIFKRNLEGKYPAIVGIKNTELAELITIIKNNPFLNTQELEKVVLEKPETKCCPSNYSHNSYRATLLLQFMQAIKADPNPYVEKIIRENPNLSKPILEDQLLEFIGFNKTAKYHDHIMHLIRDLKPIENLNPELKEYFRDKLLLQNPKAYEDLIKQQEKENKKSQGKFAKLKSFFKKHENERIM